MNRPINRTQVESVMKKLPASKSPGPYGMTGELPNIKRRSNTNTSRTFPKKLKRREYFQIHFTRPALHRYQSQKRVLQRKKITGQCP